MGENRLPEQFVGLEPFIDWALATELERVARRQSAGMPAIRDFYGAMMARIEEILRFLEGYATEKIPADVNRLFLLTLSLAEVAPAVELFSQPGVIDGFEFKRFVPVHD